MSVDIRAPQDEALSRLILIRLGEALRRAEGSGDTDDDQTSP
jgi:hypothetical protein